MKSITFFFVSIFAGIAMLGCVRTEYRIQYSISIRADNSHTAALVREGIRDFSLKEGFIKEVKGGNSEFLEKEELYNLSFMANDGSFISLINIAKVNCYNVAVYSAHDDLTAKEVGSKMVSALQKKSIKNSDIYFNSDCISKK